MVRWPWSRNRNRPSATLYSKDGCGLCEEALRNVERTFGASNVDVIDIIGNRELEDAYIFRIPVLVVNGQVRAEGLITMADARAAYRAGAVQRTSAESL